MSAADFSILLNSKALSNLSKSKSERILVKKSSLHVLSNNESSHLSFQLVKFTHCLQTYAIINVLASSSLNCILLQDPLLVFIHQQYIRIFQHVIHCTWHICSIVIINNRVISISVNYMWILLLYGKI